MKQSTLTAREVVIAENAALLAMSVITHDGYEKFYKKWARDHRGGQAEIVWDIVQVAGVMTDFEEGQPSFYEDGASWYEVTDALAAAFVVGGGDLEDEQVYEIMHRAGEAADKPEPTCDECTNGWCHMNEDSDGHGEIQRCDTCKQLSDDDEAVSQHAIDHPQCTLAL